MALLIVLLVLASAQSALRDPRAAAAAHSAVVRGVVLDEVTRAPIPGARVSIAAPFDADDTAGRDDRFNAEAIADASGSFEFTGVPAGDLVLSASDGELRARYLSRVVGHDRSRFSTRPSFRLKPGEVKEGIVIPLARALAIEGRVLNEYGEPMAEISVTARGEDTQVAGGGAATDDRGYFRIFGLAAGSYRVCASPAGGWPGRAANGDLQQRYDTTCAAGFVSVGGADTPATTIQMARVAAYSVRGTIVSTGAADAKTWVNIVAVKTERQDGVEAVVRDRQFTAQGLLPGEYAVSAGLFEEDGRGRRKTLERGFTTFRLESSDVDGITVTTLPPVSISGRVVRDPRARDRLPSSVKVRVIPPLDRMSFIERQIEATAARDGTFRMDGVFGPQIVIVSDLPAGWFVEGIRSGGADISGEAHEFRTVEDRTIEIVLSDRSAMARVRPVDGDGRLVEDAVVILLPADPRKWQALYAYPRSVSKDGVAEFRAQKPGGYLAVAITPQDVGKIWRDRNFEALAPLGRPITLAEGEVATVDVRVRSLGEAR